MKSKHGSGYAAQGTGNAATSTVDNVQLAGLKVSRQKRKSTKNQMALEGARNASPTTHGKVKLRTARQPSNPRT